MVRVNTKQILKKLFSLSAAGIVLASTVMLGVGMAPSIAADDDYDSDDYKEYQMQRRGRYYSDDHDDDDRNEYRNNYKNTYRERTEEANEYGERYGDRDSDDAQKMRERQEVRDGAGKYMDDADDVKEWAERMGELRQWRTQVKEQVEAQCKDAQDKKACAQEVVSKNLDRLVEALKKQIEALKGLIEKSTILTGEQKAQLLAKLAALEDKLEALDENATKQDLDAIRRALQDIRKEFAEFAGQMKHAAYTRALDRLEHVVSILERVREKVDDKLPADVKTKLDQMLADIKQKVAELAGIVGQDGSTADSTVDADALRDAIAQIRADIKEYVAVLKAALERE